MDKTVFAFGRSPRDMRPQSETVEKARTRNLNVSACGSKFRQCAKFRQFVKFRQCDIMEQVNHLTIWKDLRMTFVNCFSSSFFLHSHDSSLLSYCDDNLVNHAAGRSAGRPRQRDHRGAQQPGKLCERLVGRDQHLAPLFWTTG